MAKLSNGQYFEQVAVEQVAADTYLGEQTIVGNGANQAATLPAGTTMVWAMAEGAAAYLCVNGTASATSGMYIPQDQVRLVGPFVNLTSLGTFQASNAANKVHLVYAK